MNPIIKKQLDSCKVANIPSYSEDDLLIKIPKGSIVEVSPYQVGKCYLVEIADFVINPSDGNTLASNWNKGTCPKNKYYKCEISKIVGKMICILGYGYNIETNQDTLDLWEGWVPQSGIKLLKELK